MAKISRYNPPLMRSTADELSRALKDFQRSKAAVEEIITALNASWSDSVNLKYSGSYLNFARPKADELDKLIRRYTSLMYQCSSRFASTIDSGNSYLTGF